MSGDHEGTVYRSAAKVALTTPGVVVIGGAVPLLAALLDVLVTDGLTWVYGLPLVLASGYCAWEARADARRTALVVPPITTLLASVLAALMTDGFSGVTAFGLSVFRVLAGQAAPMLLAAEVLAAVVVYYRSRKERPTRAAPRP